MISKGKTEIQFGPGQQSQNFKFVKGKRGFGLEIIPHPPYNNPINYLNKNMFSPHEGTIAFWIKPVGWKGGDSTNHYFVTVYGATAYFMIYKFYPGDTWVYLAGPGGKTTVVGNSNSVWGNGKKWVFLAFTFKPGEQCFYVNGKLSGKSTTDLIEQDFSKSCQLSIDEGSQIIDEIMTFDRALTETEIEALYKSNYIRN